MPSGHAPKRPKIDPSRSQEATFSVLNFDLNLGSILVPFWLPKCLPLGTLLATKIDPKNDPKFDCSKCRVQIATRPPKTSPGFPQERPKTPQDHPKTCQEPLREPQDPPKCSQEPSRSPHLRFSTVPLCGFPLFPLPMSTVFRPLTLRSAVWNESGIALLFIERMLHSISSKSLVLPYGKYLCSNYATVDA